MGVAVASRFWGTTMELMAPPNDSDNRSEAVSIGNGERVSSTGGAVIGMAGNEISATSIVRKGCSLSG